MAKDKAVDSAVLDGYFSDIANAIRGKNGESGTYTPAQMPAKITAIPSGGGDNLPARVDGSLTSFSDSAITKIDRYAFYYYQHTFTVDIGNDITTVGTSAFQSCYLSSIVFRGNVGYIQSNAFNTSSCMLFDFSNCTGVPTLQNRNSFGSINSNAKIVVPDDLYDTWIGATNWSNYASYIIKKTDYDAL